MKNMTQHPFPDAQRAAELAFTRWIPRRCTPEWLALVTGPARFGWDVEAIQRGFIDPMYEYADARPERWRPALAALLIQAGGGEPGRFQAALVAPELQYLASLMLEHFRNARTIADATPANTRIPMPVAVTVAYTARQMASSLIICHEEALPPATRTWLAYRISRALYQTSAGAAVDFHAASQGTPLAGGGWSLELRAAPLTFTLSVDCALAAVNRMDVPEVAALREGAGLAGIAYRLAVDLISRRDQARGEAPPILLEPLLQASALAPARDESPAQAWQRASSEGKVAAVLEAARRRRTAAKEAIASVPGPLGGALRAFVEAVVDPRLAEAEEVSHAK
jgi:hypothetical protein